MKYYLSKRIIKGNIYWYACRNIWTPRGSRVAEQIYLGSANAIVNKMKEDQLSNITLKGYRYGRVAALLSIAEELHFHDIVNKCVEKTKGLSPEELLLLVPLGKFEHQKSKLKTVEWYQKSYLPYYFSLPKKISEDALYRILDKLDEETQERICDEFGLRLKELGLTPSKIILDYTNFATYIEKGEELPQKGISKDGKRGQNLVGLALAVTDQNIPFLYEAYEGNKPDAKLLPQIVDKITIRLKELTIPCEDIVLIFDRGNNSTDNIDIVLEKEMHIIGGVKRNQIEALFKIPVEKFEYLYESYKNNKVYGYKTKQKLFGREFTCVITYNKKLEERQKKTFEENKKKVLKELREIDGKLKRKGCGRKLTVAGAVRLAKKLIPDDIASVVSVEIENNRFVWEWNKKNEKKLLATFGKQVLFTDLHGWETKDIVMAYHGKSMIEGDIKMMKNALVLPIPPINHRKDNRIKAHVFLCVIGILMFRYMMWKIEGLGLTDEEVLEALDGIEISLIQDKKRHRMRWIVNQLDLHQATIFTRLGLERFLPGNKK